VRTDQPAPKPPNDKLGNATRLSQGGGGESRAITWITAVIHHPRRVARLTVGRGDHAVKCQDRTHVFLGGGPGSPQAQNDCGGIPAGVSLGQQTCRVQAVDEVHRYPQLALGFAAAMNADDVGMP
jgi:hypothetical protein